MKHLPNIVGGLLGFLFVAVALMFLLKLGTTPPPPEEGSASAHFMTAFIPTGYMTLVKVLEVLGGLLVAIPKTRNFGLLILGPIIVNIVAYTALVNHQEGLFSPMLIGICVAALYLLWVGRRQFINLKN